MGLLVGPVEFLLLQSEVPADHDGAAAREVPERERENGIDYIDLRWR